MRRLPIRMRVAAAFAVAMAIVLAGTGLFLYSRLSSHLATELDRELRLRAQDLAGLVRQAPPTVVLAGGGRFVESGESYAEVVDTKGRVRDATPSLHSTPLLDPAELRAATTRTIFANRSSVPGLDEPSRLLATPIVRRGERLVLVVGATRENRAETLRSVRNELLIVGPIALALATLAGYALAGLSLRPVEDMRLRAESISAETPGERLPVPATGDEVERLGETLNAMLARLETALDRERNFVADAGHELRTPLALLRTELELALRHAETADELREAARLSSLEVDRLAQLADDLLLIARSEQGKLSLRLEALDASELLSAVAKRFEWRAQEAGRRVLTHAEPGCVVAGDRIRLEQALSNLVDNALRHGGGDVRLEAQGAGGLVEIRVTDEGRGFPSDYLDHVFERFARPQQSRTGGGAGLGLSIVRVIAEAHGGTADVRRESGTGAEVRIAVPRAVGGCGDSGTESPHPGTVPRL